MEKQKNLTIGSKLSSHW